MKDEILNILKEHTRGIEDQKLIDYLHGKLSPAEQYDIEKQMANSDFINDAVEGLGDVADKNALKKHIEQLNKGLHNQLKTNTKRREKRRLQVSSWIYYTIALILILCVIAFIVIRQVLR